MVLPDLKDYDVKQSIGKGAFGETFRVQAKATGTPYVLKQVCTAFSSLCCLLLSFALC